MLRRPPRSTLFPSRRSSDLLMTLLTLKRAAVPLKRDVIFLATADEEIGGGVGAGWKIDRKSTRLNSSHLGISYAVFCLKKKKEREQLRGQMSHARQSPTSPN